MSNTIKRIATTTLLAAGIAAGAAGAASATIVNIGGGTWDYGVGGGTVWSDYYHGSSCHSSSVSGEYYSSSGATAAGSWARASAPDTWMVDHSYWNNQC
ncbi:lactococcin 972 family bacteriocin [Nocardiopsis quinghaiensis]|uniref:lactococcin 972 family bacteriocin n=1 Tax=Nocardiopsis quinghaiensis TaxID=464995 RepID=UPI00123B0FB0|nr:lactococcin 972 family bacteriocin [Nocardiopsis quinghaiensis]